MAHLVAMVAAVAMATAPPTIHFHRRDGEMNDPNGMLFRTDSAGVVTYVLRAASSGVRCVVV